MSNCSLESATPVRPDRWAVGLTRRLSLCLALLCWLWLGPLALAGERVALIVGNANYAAQQALKNPINDASLLAEVFTQQLGFDRVIVKSDLKRRDLALLPELLEREARRADTIVVYYSGHGIQAQGENYLIPVDAQISEPGHIKAEGVAASELVEALRRLDPKVAVLILDACRNNPFPLGTKGVQRGLARIAAVGSGMLIAYATQAGDTAEDGAGNHSPYALALSQHLRRKELRILEIFDEVASQVRQATGERQRPTRYGDLPVNVFFEGNPALVAPAIDAERLSWEASSQRHTAAAYAEFLQRYPNGKFAAAARLAQEQLQQASHSPAYPAPLLVSQPAAIAPGLGGSSAANADCATCRCGDLLEKLSLGIDPLSAAEARFLQKSCGK